MEPRSPALLMDSLPAEPQGKPCVCACVRVYIYILCHMFIYCISLLGCVMSVVHRFLQLQLTGLVAAQQVGSSLPNQGLNLHPLRWKADS